MRDVVRYLSQRVRAADVFVNCLFVLGLVALALYCLT
jgi:hypothetical protein